MTFVAWGGPPAASPAPGAIGFGFGFGFGKGVPAAASPSPSRRGERERDLERAGIFCGNFALHVLNIYTYYATLAIMLP